MSESGFPQPGAVPYLTVRAAREAIDWYTQTFDAGLLSEPIVMPDGRIGHAELSLGAGVVYLAEEFPEMGLLAPQPGATSVSMMLPVADTDVVLTRARRAGGRVERWTYEGHGRRNATLIDPFGHRWMLAGPLATTVRAGDIGYLSWWTPDAARARAFYGPVLGWEFELGEAEDLVTNLSRPVGLHGGHGTSTLFCCFAVDDLEGALSAVRTAGGDCGRIIARAEGSTVRCTDDQGAAFALYEPRSEDSRPPVNGAVPGDPSYVTLEVPDSVAARRFYGAVLGWRFEAGTIADGWVPVGVHPMCGIAGGRESVTVPMWRVEDVAGALDRVRAGGGRVLSGPDRRPYGVSAECLDDQGGRFYLGA